MTTLREAAQAVADYEFAGGWWPTDMLDRIDALRAALAAPEPPLERACGHTDPRSCDINCRVEELERIVHPEGRCEVCGGGKPYWKHLDPNADGHHVFIGPRGHEPMQPLAAPEPPLDVDGRPPLPAETVAHDRGVMEGYAAAKRDYSPGGMYYTEPPLDVERLRKAALAHARAEQKAWADKGEYGVIHVCDWHDTKCAAAIAREYAALTPEDKA